MRDDNCYLILELFLDPPEDNWSALETKIKEKKNEWNKKRNSADGLKYQKLCEEIDSIALTLQNPTKRKKQATEAIKLKLAELDKHIAIATADGSIAPEQIELIIKRYKVFFNESTIRSRIGVPEKTEQKRALAPPVKPSDYPELTSSVNTKLKQVELCLKTLGFQTIYQALGLSGASRCQLLLEASAELEDKGQKASQKDSKANAYKDLGGLAKEIFKTDNSKAEFDKNWAHYVLSQKLKENFEYRIIARKDEEGQSLKIVSEDDYERSISEAVDEGMSDADAQWFVYDYYVNKRKCADPRTGHVGRRVDNSIKCPNCFKSNDPNANKCGHCGYTLKNKCPICGTTSTLQERCSSCGFSFVNMENSILIHKKAKELWAENDLDGAITGYRKAYSLWEGNPALRAFGDELRTAYAQREYERFLQEFANDSVSDYSPIRFSFDATISESAKEYAYKAKAQVESQQNLEKVFVELDELCQKNLFFTADQKLNAIAKRVQERPDFPRKRQTIDEGLARAKSELADIEKADTTEREKLLEALLLRYPDFEDARKLQSAQEVQPVPNVTVLEQTKGVEVRWARSESIGVVNYQVLRAEIVISPSGEISQTAFKVICANTNDLFFLDCDVEEFRGYVYSIVSFRSDSNFSKETSSTPIQRTGGVHKISVVPKPNQIKVEWNISPHAKGVVVTRENLSDVNEPKVVVSNADLKGFIDVGLTNDNEYRYAVSVVYYDVDGKERKTKPTHFTAHPYEPPTPITNWTCDITRSDSHDRLDLKWQEPTVGKALFFVASRSFGLLSGQTYKYSLDELYQKFGRPLHLDVLSPGTVDRPAHALALAPKNSTYIYVLPITYEGSDVVVGQERALNALSPVKKISSELVDNDVFVSWEWTPGVNKCLLLYSDKRLPSGLDDQTCARKIITKQEYDLESAWILAGQETRPLYVKIFQVYETGEKTIYSPGEKFFTVKALISYRVCKKQAKKGWGLKKLFGKTQNENRIEITPFGSNLVTPEIVVVRRFDRPPYRRDDGEILTKIPASKSGAFTFSLSDLVSDDQIGYLSCFCANPADAKFFTMLQVF